MTTTRTAVELTVLARLRAIALVGLIAVVVTACGGGGGGGGGGGAPAPAPTVAAASRWDVSLATTTCLRPGAPLALSVTVFTSTGAVIPSPRYEVASNLADALEPDGAGGWRVRGEGAARVTVTYTGDIAPGATLTPATFDLIRDGQPPQIAVHQPARGAMIVATSDVRVQGMVTDATSPLASVTVNGVEQLSGPTPAYTIDVAPSGRWGLNVVEVTATDACGNTARASQSHLRSGEYRPQAIAASAPARVARGQAFRLRPAAIDDGDRNDVDDIATMIDRYLELNLNSVVRSATSGVLIASAPHAACPSAGYRLSILSPGATVTAPYVNSLALRAGGTQQTVSLQRVTVPLRFEQISQVGIPLTGCLETRVPFSATISATVTSTSTSNVAVQNGRVDVTMPSVTVTLSDVDIDFTGVAAVDNVLSSLVDAMRSSIQSAIADALRDTLPPLFEAFLNAPLTVSGGVSSGPLGLGVTLTAIAGADGVTATTAALSGTAYTQIYPSRVGTPYLGLGAIARPTTAPDLSANAGPVTYAIDDNVINQVFWALWYGGGIEGTDVIGMPGAALEVSARLPPVLMPGTQPGRIAFGFGDLEVALRLDYVPGVTAASGPVTVEAYVSYLLDGTIGYDAASRVLRATPNDQSTFVQTVRVRDSGGDVADPVVRERIVAYAEPLMARSIEQFATEVFASTPLPPLRFEFGSGDVDAVTMEITGVTRTADHLTVDMYLKAEVPPPLDAYLTMNNPWTEQDLIANGVPSVYRDSTVHIEDSNANLAASRSVTVRDYQRTTRPACEAAGLFDGAEKCLPEFQNPLNYGWYCGAGRPVEGFTDNPRLDPVDYCCLLHDRGVWADAIDLEVPERDEDLEGFIEKTLEREARNACGAAMCYGMVTYSSPDLEGVLPDVERARQTLYNRAMLLCRVPPIDLTQPQQPLF